MKPSLIFEHVPKAGGISLHNVLQRYYQRSKTFKIEGSNPARSIEHFKSLPVEERCRFELISGHGAYKLRDYIPRATVCATMLRDPVERIISHFYFVKSLPNHRLYDDVRASSMSLKDYALIDLTGELRHNYVRRFSRLSTKSVDADPGDALELAKKNLNRDFICVGLLEHFSLSLALFKMKLKWETRPYFRKKNITRKRRKLQELDDETVSALMDVTSLDRQLYNYTFKRFESEIQRAGISCRKEAALIGSISMLYELSSGLKRMLSSQ